MLHSSTTLSTLEYFSSRPTQTDRLMTVEAKSARKLLLILLDGARWDYEQKFNMKNLEKIRLKGFSADELQPCYPTMSAPNFYSAVTGKYPGNHGLINNKMFDAVKNVEFASFANPPDPICLQEMWWRAAEPIWISAAKKKLNVHMFRWFGSTIARDNIVPKLSSEYVEGYPVENMEKDLLEAINLFIDDESDFIGYYCLICDISIFKHLNLLNYFKGFYVGAIDDAGHSSGPESMEMKEACKIVDENLGMLLELLETKKDKYGRLLKNEVNTIIFSDHGMTQLDSQKVVDIHAVLDRLHPKHHILLDCTLSIWTENDDHTNQVFAKYIISNHALVIFINYSRLSKNFQRFHT